MADIVNFKNLKSGRPSLLWAALKRIISYQHSAGNIPLEQRPRQPQAQEAGDLILYEYDV